MSKCNFHEPRGTTHGDGAIHHPCGCAVLRTDREDHEAGECGNTTFCYFCRNVPTQTCERMLERIDGEFEQCDEPAALGTRYCWEHQDEDDDTEDIEFDDEPHTITYPGHDRRYPISSTEQFAEEQADLAAQERTRDEDSEPCHCERCTKAQWEGTYE